MKTSLHPGRAIVNSSIIYPRQAKFLCPACQHLSNFRSKLPFGPSLSRAYSNRRRDQSTWAQAVSVAQSLLSDRGKEHGPFAGVSVDPLRIVGKEMKFLRRNIQQLLGSGHPLLDTVAKYYTNSDGKHIRPLLVLLMSRATSLAPKTTRQFVSGLAPCVDSSLSPSTILADVNPSSPANNTFSISNSGPEYASEDSSILPSQRRLAEITELIHTASLLHDDVIDNSTARRSSPSANIFFGNKMAVLAGDFLLGRASVALARLRDVEVIELVATVIANLVEGEFMQLKNTALDESKPKWTNESMSYYLDKTYLKSASLISKSCRAAALLGQSSPEVVEAAYAYGKNLGLAFQLIDDMLDYTISGEELGKPAGADLELGLATAPLLFAWKENPELSALVGRKFAGDGDVKMARELVLRSDGIAQTRALAQEYADKATDAIRDFPDSDAKEGLIEMCVKTMKRRK